MKFTGSLFLLIFFFTPAVLRGQSTLHHLAPEYFYQEGLELFRKEKYTSAITSLEEYRKSTGTVGPMKTDAKMMAVIAHLKLNHAQGIKDASDFQTENPTHPGIHLVLAESGNYHFNRKSYEQAAEAWSSADLFLLNADKRSEYRFKLGYSYFAQKQFEKAGPVFSLVKSQNGAYRSSGYYYSAYINYKLDNYKEALADLNAIENDETYKNLAPAMIITIHYKLKDYNQVIAYAEKNLSQSNSAKNPEDVALLVGEAYFQKGDYKKALEYFESSASRSNASRSDINYRMGFASYQLKDYKKAVEYLKRITNQQDTISQYASYYLGNSYLNLNDKTFALGAFEFAQKPDYSLDIKENAWFQAGKVMFELGRFTSVINSFNLFEKQFPQSVFTEDVMEMLSESYLHTSNFDLAISYIEGVKKPGQKLKTTYQKVTYQKGLNLYNDGKYEDATNLFDKSLSSVFDLDTKLAAEYWQAENYSARRLYKLAAGYYQKVIYSPNALQSGYFYKAKYGLGYACYNQNDFTNAILHLKAFADKRDAGTSARMIADAELRLADSYYATKDYTTAFAYYERVSGRNFPQQDYVAFQKGVVRYMQGKNTEAKSFFDQVITVYATSRYVDEALYQKAQVELEEGSFQPAAGSFTRLINRQPESVIMPYAYLKRAVCYYNTKDYEKASSDYKYLLDKYLDHPVANSALLGLQESLNQQGKPDDFNVYFEKYKKMKPTDQSLEGIEFQTAKNLYFSEKYDKAITAFREYLKNHPGSANILEANYFLAESYTRSGKPAEAMLTYQIIINKGKTIYYNKSVNRSADLSYQSGDYQMAISYFELLNQQPETQREQNNAWIGLAESYFNLSKWDSTDYYCGQLIRSGSPNPLLMSRAMLLHGKAKIRLGQNAQATDIFMGLSNQSKDEFGAQAQYLLADIQYKEKKYDQSMETLYDLSKNFGQYEIWLGKAFLLIAENLVAKDEILQAKATLSSIIERSPNEETRNLATKRLEELTLVEIREGGDEDEE